MAPEMKSMPTWVRKALPFAVLGVLVLWLMGAYNGFVSKEVGVEKAWSDIETQYQRRADLVPQLVATVQGAANFEKSTFTAVTEARTAWLNSQSDVNATPEQQIAAANQFDSALSRLLVSVEAYPELKATANFQTLQAQLEGTENRIAVARKDYNEVTADFNSSIRQIPGSLIAAIFGFDKKPLFEATAGAETAPVVDFESEL